MALTMNIGDRVKIDNYNYVFNGKDGTLEEINEGTGTCRVFVDFVPDEDKKIRQKFPLECVFTQGGIESISEGKKSPRSSKNDLKNEIRYDTSFLVDLKDAMEEKDFKQLTNYPYNFKLLVSRKFINGFNLLRNTVISSDKDVMQFLKLFDRVFARLDDYGVFKGVASEKVNGLANKYSGNIKELKLGEINSKPIRILYFTLPDKTMVLGNIFYHKGENLNEQERTSINDIYDRVKNV